MSEKVELYNVHQLHQLLIKITTYLINEKKET